MARADSHIGGKILAALALFQRGIWLIRCVTVIFPFNLLRATRTAVPGHQSQVCCRQRHKQRREQDVKPFTSKTQKWHSASNSIVPLASPPAARISPMFVRFQSRPTDKQYRKSARGPNFADVCSISVQAYR